MTAESSFPVDRAERGRSTHAAPTSQAAYLRSAVLPAAVIAMVCVAAAVVALATHGSAIPFQAALAGVSCGAVAMLVVAFAAARAAGRRVDRQVRECRLVVQRGQAQLQQLADQVMRGEQPALPAQVPARVSDDPFRLLAAELGQFESLTAIAVLRVAERVPAERTDHRVEIFVNLARRMQSLVHREIEMLDDLESKVEDPELLKGLFTVDHLATRLRRQSESLAVLGGSSSRRQWTRQVTMHEVLRAAVAEVEQYSRVKVVPPVEGVLRGTAVTDVIHLIAELVENATKFSAPTTITLLRSQQVAAGVAIEVEDRGLGMVAADQQRLNELLADPGRMDIDELLRDGRIGLYVVAALARRHGIKVRLQNNIYGGTQAVAVLPRALLDPADRGPSPASAALPAASGERDNSPRLALAATGGGAGMAGAVPALPSAGERAQPALRTRRPVSGASSSAAAWAVTGDGHDTEARPPLPRRQTHAAAAGQPPNHVTGAPGRGSAPRGAEPPADQMTGLMADFLKGVSLAEQEQSSPQD